MRKSTLYERKRLRLRVLFHPPHILMRLPPMQHMRQRDRCAHEDMVQHDERGQPRRRGALCEARSLKEQEGPQCAEGAILRARGVEASARGTRAFAFTLGDEGTEGKLELGHVSRKLEFARLVEGLDDRDVQDKGSEHVSYDVERPVTTHANLSLDTK